MLKIIKEEKEEKKEETKEKAVTNRVYYEIAERTLNIMKDLEETNSFSKEDSEEITTQTMQIVSALDKIQYKISAYK